MVDKATTSENTPNGWESWGKYVLELLKDLSSGLDGVQGKVSLLREELGVEKVNIANICKTIEMLQRDTQKGIDGINGLKMDFNELKIKLSALDGLPDKMTTLGKEVAEVTSKSKAYGAAFGLIGTFVGGIILLILSRVL